MNTERTFEITPAPRGSVTSRPAGPSAVELAPAVPGRHPSLLRVVWRRRRIVLLAFVLGGSAGVLYLSRATPVYTSSARLLVERSKPMIIATSEGLMTQSKNYLYTQCELLKSTPILSQAAESLGSRKLRVLEGEANRVGLLKAGVHVSLGKANDIITVAFDCPYPAESAEIVNAIVESYVAYQSSQQRNTAAEILKILQREKVRRDAELKERFQAAMAFKRDNEIISFGSADSNIILQRLDTLSDALTRAELAAIEAKARYDTTRLLLGDPHKVLHLRDRLLASQGTGTRENNVLEAERSRLNLELSSLMQECTADHPAVQTTQLKLKQLEQREAQRAAALGQAHLAWLGQQAVAAASRVEELKKSLAGQRTLAQQLNSKAVEYAMLEAEQKRAERICDILDSRIKEIDITDDAGALNLSLLETARPAGAPSSPDRAQVMAIALALGLLLGTSLAFVGEWMDHRLRSAEEVSEALGLPVLGVLPRQSGRRKFASVAKVVDIDPSSRAAEAYRTVRTAVYFGSPDIETKTILVTSPAPGDGKSTLVSNLAAAMAQAGQKVLILDGDLRKPSQHKVFGIDADAPGVPDVLVGAESLDAAIQHTDVERLDVLPCGTIPPNPSEVLNSQAFDDLLADLGERYDRVVVDAPPTLSLADARILGARCDAALLVLRAGKSSRRPSQQAVDGLLSVGTRILGVVVNGVDRRGQGYGYDGYGYSYRYGHYGKALEGRTDSRESGGDAVRADAA